MPELPLLLFVGLLVIGIVLLMRREHHLLEQDEPQRLNTRGPDDR